MGLDAIIIADSSTDSMSGTSALRLHLDGKEATIQNIIDYIYKQPLRDDETASWSSTLKLNGIFLYSYLSQYGFDVALINNFEEERERFVELSAEQPAAIIISSTFIMNKEVLRKLVADIRSILPHAYIIAGGAYVNISYMILQRELASPGYLMTPGRKDYLFALKQELEMYGIIKRRKHPHRGSGQLKEKTEHRLTRKLGAPRWRSVCLR